MAIPNAIQIPLLLTLFLSFHFFLLAKEEESLVVRVATENALAPLYLFSIESTQSDFKDDYTKQLEKILSFDLNHNGSTTVVQRSVENDRLGQGETSHQLGSASQWKERHIFYVVKLFIEGKSLKAFLLDVEQQSLKSSESFVLTGLLRDDRRQIHRLADMIYKAFFHTEGVASTRIVYTVKTVNSSDNTLSVSEVWEADYDGGNAHPITQENSYCVTPIYLPPKPGYTTGAVLYVSYQLGQPKIFISSLKDGKKRRLTSIRGNQLMPAVSQQRDKVAFICDVTGNPDLFLQPFSPEQGAIGKAQQIFSARQATQGSPTFSPDGKQIAFVSNKDGSPKIYVIQIPEPGAEIKNVKATLISKSNRENSAPSWSPDGTKLAYCARSGGARQIWIYDFNTKQEKQLTKGPEHKENPSWAPDNFHVAFNSSSTNSSELFMMHLQETEPTQITSGLGEKRFPNWEPRVYKHN